MAEVTQADREAAWAARPNLYSENDKDRWMAGVYDQAPGSRIQAFARHRTEAVKPLVEALEELLPTMLCGEGWGLPDDETVSITVTFGKLKKARAALREVQS